MVRQPLNSWLDGKNDTNRNPIVSMILTNDDIDDFVNAYSDYEDAHRSMSDDAIEAAVEKLYSWIVENPQLVVASSFQEYVGAHELPIYQQIVRDSRHLINCSRPAFRSFEGQWLLLSQTGISGNSEWDAYSLESLKHALQQEDEFEEDRLIEASVVTLPSANEIIDKARRIVASELLDVTTFVSPKLWTPFSQATEKAFLQTSAVSVIQALQNESTELKDVHWKTFEEIVAELLRSKGMEIHVVRENPQGGRDIIARTQLIPGAEILTIAVEVKHRTTVDRPILQQSLHQNRHFPALMLVTSGRFSTGVIREASLPENRMRLVLRDGVAIRELIQNYSLARPGTS